MSITAALHNSYLNSRKSARLLEHSRDVLREFTDALIRSDNNLAKSRALLAPRQSVSPRRGFARRGSGSR